MRALLADPSDRLRSWMGSILDRSGDLCHRLGGWCWATRERLDPTPGDLTPAAADRILAGVMVRIAAASVPPFVPTAFERGCAEVAFKHQSQALLANTPAGPRALVFPSRTTAGQA